MVAVSSASHRNGLWIAEPPWMQSPALNLAPSAVLIRLSVVLYSV